MFRQIRWFGQLLVGCLSFTARALPQVVSFGVTAGVPVTDPIEGPISGTHAGYTYGFPQYLIGPDVQLRLPFHLRVEADALYRRLAFSYNDINSSLGYFSSTSVKINS